MAEEMKNATTRKKASAATSPTLGRSDSLRRSTSPSNPDQRMERADTGDEERGNFRGATGQRRYCRSQSHQRDRVQQERGELGDRAPLRFHAGIESHSSSAQTPPDHETESAANPRERRVANGDRHEEQHGNREQEQYANEAEADSAAKSLVNRGTPAVHERRRQGQEHGSDQNEDTEGETEGRPTRGDRRRSASNRNRRRRARPLQPEPRFRCREQHRVEAAQRAPIPRWSVEGRREADRGWPSSRP